MITMRIEEQSNVSEYDHGHANDDHQDDDDNDDDDGDVDDDDDDDDNDDDDQETRRAACPNSRSLLVCLPPGDCCATA